MPKGMNKANILRIAAIVLACVHFPVANAFVIDSSTNVGDTFDVSWELLSGASDAGGIINNTGFDISGGATFEYLGTDGTEIGFELTLSNTTGSPSNSANTGLIGFGFGTDANFTVASWGDSPSVTDTDKIVSFTGTNSSGVPTSPSTPTNRFYATAGGGSGGLAPGESDVFEFKLKLPDVIAPTTQPITFNPLEAVYLPQPPNGTSGVGGPEPLRVAVPVPGTLVLIGAGLIMIRRRLLAGT